METFEAYRRTGVSTRVHKSVSAQSENVHEGGATTVIEKRSNSCSCSRVTITVCAQRSTSTRVRCAEETRCVSSTAGLSTSHRRLCMRAGDFVTEESKRCAQQQDNNNDRGVAADDGGTSQRIESCGRDRRRFDMAMASTSNFYRGQDTEGCNNDEESDDYRQI